mgnify:CR=1 FL=1
MDSDFDDDHEADEGLDGRTVYRIFHAMEVGDFSVFVAPKDGAPDTRRAALYCQFKAEAWFGDEVMLSNLGVASLLVQFYDHLPAPRLQSLRPEWFIDLYGDREAACGEECHELMADQSLVRSGLMRAMHPFLMGLDSPAPLPEHDE